MPSSVRVLAGAAFLSFPDMYDMLVSELCERFCCDLRDSVRYGDLLYVPHIDNLLINNFNGGANASGAPVSGSGALRLCTPYWCRTAMLSPFVINFDSIGEAAHALTDMQRGWAPYQYQFFRRASLIQKKLPYVNLKARTFPAHIPASPVGLYTLIEEGTMLASSATTSLLPAGAIRFTENHEDPPSRAYLKLYEALMFMYLFFGCEAPREGERCFDAGASPGGWTWVLAGSGCDVFAVDRAELVPKLMKHPRVEFLKHDAFTLKPEEVGACDWVFSDVICYPARLYDWIAGWLSSGLCKNMICTIKMQGGVDWKLMEKFAALPDSRIVHLNYNKHELTWLHCDTKR